MVNTTDFLSAISGIRLFDVCHYIVGLGIILSQKRLIKNEEQNQTVPVFNAYFLYLKESNATGAKVLLLREMRNKTYSDTAFDMKYVNETYEHIINEGLFAYYGNMTGYLFSRNFSRNTNFTHLKTIVFDHLSKNYINNVSCSLGNVSSKLGISLSPVAIDNLFADYLWPVFKRTEKNFRRTENNLEKRKKRELQIHRRMKRQIFINDDSMDLDFLNSLEGNAEDTAVENLWPTFAGSDFNKWPFVDTDFSSHPKIRRINTSTIFSGLQNEINHNQDEVVNKEKDFQDMTNFHDNHVPQNSSFEIGIDDILGSFRGSYASRREPFSRSRDNRKRLGFTDESEIWESLGSDNHHFDVDNGTNRKILNLNDDVGGNGRFISDWENKDKGNILMVPQNETNVQEGTIREDSVQEESAQDDTVLKGELNVKRLVEVQVDYAGRREPVHSIFKNMEIDKKSKRMQFIANAAIIISSNASINYTFEDSLKMLKGYILKLEESGSPVPTYKNLAVDFCASNLNAPEKYSDWKKPNHPLIDDVLFETNFYESITEKELIINYLFRTYPEPETLKSLIVIYNNSSLLQESLKLQDFIILKDFSNIIVSKLSVIRKKRFTVALYRLVLRECEQDWSERSLDLFSMNYAPQTIKLNKTLSIGGSYTFNIFTNFTADKILEQEKLFEPHSVQLRPMLLEIKIDNSAGIANIGRIFNTNVGTYMIASNTMKVSDKFYKNVHGQNVLHLKLEDKRSKEDKIIDIVWRLQQLVNTAPKDFTYYNLTKLTNYNLHLLS